MRVAALKRLFERKAGSPRLYRHEIYEFIEKHANEAWMLGGFTDKHRAIAQKQGRACNLKPTDPLIIAWADALKSAFNGLVLSHISGTNNPETEPNGWWTTELLKL